MNQATGTILQEIIKRESRSLLLYIGEAFPWTTAAHAPDLVALKNLVEKESAAITALGKYLVRRRFTPPFFGSYPASFTACNFIDLTYLLPRLLAAQEKLIGQMTDDLHRLVDTDARAELERLLAVKQATLAGLQGLITSRTQPASA